MDDPEEISLIAQIRQEKKIKFLSSERQRQSNFIYHGAFYNIQLRMDSFFSDMTPTITDPKVTFDARSLDQIAVCFVTQDVRTGMQLFASITNIDTTIFLEGGKGLPIAYDALTLFGTSVDEEVRQNAMYGFSQIVSTFQMEPRLKQSLVRIFCDHLRDRSPKVRAEAVLGLTAVRGFSRAPYLDIPFPSTKPVYWKLKEDSVTLAPTKFRLLRKCFEDFFHGHGVDFGPNHNQIGYDCSVLVDHHVVDFDINFFRIPEVFPPEISSAEDKFFELIGASSESNTVYRFVVEFRINLGDHQVFRRVVHKIRLALRNDSFLSPTEVVKDDSIPYLYSLSTEADSETVAEFKFFCDEQIDRLSDSAGRKSKMSSLSFIGGLAEKPEYHYLFAQSGQMDPVVLRILEIVASSDLLLRATAMSAVANISKNLILSAPAKDGILDVLVHCHCLQDDYLLVRSRALEALQGIISSTETECDPVFLKLKGFLELRQVHMVLGQEAFAKDRICATTARFICDHA